MLKNYITYDSFTARYPRLKSIIEESDFTGVANNAVLSIVDDIRALNITLDRIYIPKMFDALDSYARQSKTDYISSSLSGVVNEHRFVVEVDSTTGCTISLSGSHDNISFYPIKDMTGDNVSIILGSGDTGIYSVQFLETYRYFVYEISGTCNASIYMVDTGLDNLIKLKIVQLITMTLKTGDSKYDEIYNEAYREYNSLISRFKVDYDRDQSMSIDDTERNATATFWFTR